MSYLPQPGAVGFRTQSAPATYADPAADDPSKGLYVKILSGGLGADRTLISPDPEIGGARDNPDALLGPVKFAGQYEFYARFEALAMFFKHALGTSAPDGDATSGYTHTAASAADGTVPWVSIEEVVGNTFDVFQFTDCKCNTLHLEAAADNYLRGTVGYVGKTQLAGATAADAADRHWDDSPLSVGTNITVTWGGPTLPAKSFSFDLNNNIDDTDFRLGSLFLGDVPEKRREVTLSVSIRPQDKDLWREAVFGGSALTSPAGTATKKEIVITITSYDTIPGTTGPGVPYSCEITVPNAILQPFNLTPSGDNVLEASVDIMAVRPAVETDILTVVTTNGLAVVN